MKILSLLIIALFLTLTSCTKDEDVKNDEVLTFGQFFGFCAGDGCIRIYKMDQTSIKEDTTDQYPSEQFYNGIYVPLSESKFNETKDLFNSFPQDLFNESQTTIGMPDAGDWGGYYVEYKKGDQHKMWLIDKMRTNVPEKYHAFLDKIDEKLVILE